MNENTVIPQLAVGTHKQGTGYGCAMNVVAWETGESLITDFPSCSDEILAAAVQRVNDTICDHCEWRFYRDKEGTQQEVQTLCPECSMTVLDLGHRTIGTGDVAPEKMYDYARWACDLFEGLLNALIEDGHLVTSVFDETRHLYLAEKPSQAWIDSMIKGFRSKLYGMIRHNRWSRTVGWDPPNAKHSRNSRKNPPIYKSEYIRRWVGSQIQELMFDRSEFRDSDEAVADGARYLLDYFEMKYKFEHQIPSDDEIAEAIKKMQTITV